MKNKNFFLLAGVTLFLFISLFLYISTFTQPKITFTAQINNINNEDYERIMNNAQVMYSDRGIDKFRHINLKIKITTPFDIIKNVKIGNDFSEQYFIEPYLKDNDSLQLLGGGGFIHGNGLELEENIEVYLKDISQDDLENILGDLKIKASWQNIWGDKDYKNYYFKDYLNLIN